MLYLSDPIYIEKNFSEISNIGSYLPYSVFIRPVGIHPFDYSIEPYKQIYQGHIYVTGETQRIYLNDIITPHLYDHSYIKPNISIDKDGNYLSMTESNFDFPVSNVKVMINFDGNYSEEIDVLQYYADNQKHNFPSPDIETDDNPLIINLLTLRTNVLPRVPRLLNRNTTKFWLGAKFITTKGLWDEAIAISYPILNWGPIRNGRPTAAYQHVFHYLESFERDCHSQFACNVSGIGYQNLSRYTGEIGISIGNSPRVMKVAEIDECPSDFYLIWMDRTGAYQCQPFNKRTVRKENITTTNIINSIDQTRPVLKSISNTWTLNSDWLSFEEYNAYESIFTSPYLYLYDYKNDEGYWVNCTNKSWEERNSSNTKKPFNLTINLESNQSQNIIY